MSIPDPRFGDYSGERFGRDLLAQLEQGYDPIRIAGWADYVFFHAKYSHEVREALIDLFTMQEGEQFQITEEELRRIAQKFIRS